MKNQYFYHISSKIPAYCVVVLLAVFASGCSTASRQTYIPESQLKVLCQRYNIHWQLDDVSQTVTLSQGQQRATMLVGSDMVIINGRQMTLAGPVKRTRMGIVVPSDFESRIISRFKGSGTSHTIRRFTKIMIDAGHGGKDPGALGRTGYKEKIVALDIANRVKKILERNGMSVVMTRQRDEFISLEKRTEKATRAEVDLFVSIHANSAPAKRIQGMEIYYPRHPKDEENSLEQLRLNEQILFKQLSMKRDNKDLQNIISDMLANYKESESKRFASHVVKQASNASASKDRGVKEAGFFVLRNTLVPAILIEVGFLSNAREEKLLKTKSYRQKIADGIARSILDYSRN